MPHRSDKPRRVQQKRTRGWRKPAGAVSVARPSRWGNPYKVGDEAWPGVVIRDRTHAVEQYRVELQALKTIHPDQWQALTAEIRKHLRGKDLMCWCPLDQPCHADVLLELANE